MNPENLVPGYRKPECLIRSAVGLNAEVSERRNTAMSKIKVRVRIRGRVWVRIRVRDKVTVNSRLRCFRFCRSRF